LEAALLDLRLRAEGRSLADYLGATRQRVPAGVAIGIIRDLDALADTAERRLAEGYQRIKLKIEPGWDVQPVEAVRDRIGHAALQVDANGSYAHDPSVLKELDRFGLAMIEQPLADDDLVGHAALAKQIATPICLDESITSAGMAAAAIALGACAIVNVKPGRVGGLAEAVRIHDLCAEAGIPVWCGGMLETGIGRAASVALAALPNFTMPADLSASDRYYAPDLTAPFVLEDGCLRVPTGPGIGVVPDRDALAEHTISIETITP
jgi:O-succinylbenzoate synthase